MKGGTQAAVALGVGYLLGRRRKFRRAAILAAVTATGSFSGLSKALMGRGLKALGSTEMIGKLSPQLGEIADTARTELLDAGKTAAMALVSNRVESLSDSLHSRAQVLSDPAAAGAGVADVLRGGRGRTAEDGESGGRSRRSRRTDESAEDRDEYQARRGGKDEDAYDDEYEPAENGYEDEDAYDEDYAPAEDDEPGDEYESDEQDEPDEDAESAPAPRRRSRVTSSPVSRAGR